MTKHHKHQSAAHQHDPATKKRPPHKDWRTWVVVGLMLAAMVGYIMTMDESIGPGGNGDEPRVPAAP